MNDSVSKNNLFYLILLVLTLIVMVVGFTFTYFAFLAKEEDDKTRVQTGTLAVNYIDGREINANTLLPTEEPGLNSGYSSYKKSFSVANKGTLDLEFDIYMDVTKNEFASGAIGVALYDDKGNKIGKAFMPKDGKVLLDSDIYLKSGEVKDYVVLVWLQENYKNQDYEKGNIFVGGFDITADQIKYE